jgi:hypothetical protein
MKLKADFVTNSSSTSFVIISDKDVTEEGLSALTGIGRDSPFYALVEAIHSKIQEIERRRPDERVDSDSLGSDFAASVIQRIKTAQGDGKKVLTGTFSSDRDEIETFLCMDSFEAESDVGYINAVNCTW